MLLCNYFFHQTALHVDILNKYIDFECGSLGGLPEHWEGHLFQNSAALHLAFAAHAHPTQPAAADRFTSQIFPFSFYNSFSLLPAAPKFRTCQVSRSRSPQLRSCQDGPRRRSWVSGTSHIKAQQPRRHSLGTRQAPPELHHGPCSAENPQVFSLSPLSGCHQVASTPLPSAASAARTGELSQRLAGDQTEQRPQPSWSPRPSSPAPQLSPSPGRCASATAFIDIAFLSGDPWDPFPALDSPRSLPCPPSIPTSPLPWTSPTVS